jgi:hypothetical protein
MLDMNESVTLNIDMAAKSLNDKINQYISQADKTWPPDTETLTLKLNIHSRHFFLYMLITGKDMTLKLVANCIEPLKTYY